MSEQTYRPSLSHNPRRRAAAIQPARPGPRLSQVLNQVLPLPPGNVMLGLCDDGLPLLFDLNEPDSGGLLVTGDSALANGLVLKSVLLAACRMNPADSLNLNLISPRPDFFDVLEREPHLQINFHSRSKEAGLLLEEFANLIAAREESGEPSIIQLLAIDGLSEFFEALDADHQELLLWAASAGPACGAWIVAGDAPEAGAEVPVSLDEAFPTRLVNCIAEAGNPWLPEGAPIRRLAGLENGRSALLFAGGERIQVQIAQAERGDYDLLASEARAWTEMDEVLSRFPDSSGVE
ncbi:MAG: hypothetical protein HYZ26_00620 [Chloroflexi bacterium]|nr:hypothetical protein [Chloroflexota bacterium]